jgi:polyisoprenoid-binding protein YceI
MKKVLLTVSIVLAAQSLIAQVWFTKTGAVSFFSHTAIEDIKAENNEVVSFIDASKGEFRFPKAAMQDHFNDANYMNSDQFPKAEFKGSIVNTKAIDFKKDGTYKVDVAGAMTMHGVTKNITVPGTITIKAGVPSVNAVFMVKRSDFGIDVPSFSSAKIAQEIEVTVKCQYAAYKS